MFLFAHGFVVVSSSWGIQKNDINFYLLCDSNLSGLNLDGEISPAIGDLKGLVSMYCSISFSLAFTYADVSIMHNMDGIFLGLC